jgi:hypothetical protein
MAKKVFGVQVPVTLMIFVMQKQLSVTKAIWPDSAFSGDGHL